MKYQILFLLALAPFIFACKSTKNGQKTETEPVETLSPFTSAVLEKLKAHGIPPEDAEEAIQGYVSNNMLTLDSFPAYNDLAILNGKVVESDYSSKTDTFFAESGTKVVIVDVYTDTLEDGRNVLAFAVAFKGGNLDNNKYFVFTPNLEGVYTLLTFEENGRFYTEYGDKNVEVRAGVSTIFMFKFKKVEVKQKGKMEKGQGRKVTVKKRTGKNKK